MKMADNQCPHCYPFKYNHRAMMVGSIVTYFLHDPIANILSKLIPKNIRRIGRDTIMALLLKRNVATAVSEINRSHFNNMNLVFWDEAKKRDLEIYNIKLHHRHTTHFLLIFNGKKYYFDSNPIYLIPKNAALITRASSYDTKDYFKKFLMKYDLPHPIGRAFFNKKQAMNYGITLGFPLVVKPVFSSLSRHAFFDITSPHALQQALTFAKQVNCRVMVEQHIAGDVHRAIVLDMQLIACAKRQAASIVGNGTATVAQLISEKNSCPLRGEPNRLDCTLHKIVVDEYLINFLAKQHMSLTTILAKDRKIFLTTKMNTSSGGDVINVTPFIHPENKKLIEKVHTFLKLPLAGLDFICEDITTPWQQQHFAFIENNSLPYVDMHHYPSEGDAIEVAAIIWDTVLHSLQGAKPFASQNQ